MNLDASPDTIRAVAEMFKLASFLDDRIAGADRGRIAAWSEQVERHKLGREDLLDGLQKFYDGPTDRPIGVGDLIHHAKLCRRDRTEREDAELNDQRAAERDAKAADDLTSISAAALMGPTKNTARLIAARKVLQECTGRRAAMAAIGEFFAAKREAGRPAPAKGGQS